MCPSAPLLSIGIGCTDEVPVLFLGQRRVGDPIPSNVIAESPFSMEPWDSQENMWYLYNSEDSQSQKGENEIKATGKGYWKLMGGYLRIMTSTTTVGRKTMREFFIGQAPVGEGTGWMMHEYQAESQVSQGFNDAQEYSSLCRVFWQSNQNANYEEQPNPVASDDVDGEDDVDGDYIGLLILPFLDEDEENNCCLQDGTNSIEEVGRQEQRTLAASGRSYEHLVSGDLAESLQTKSDFSKDYIELDDLCSLETSSSSSDNSSLVSLNSEEYFDADALLRDLQNESCRNVGEQHVDCRFSGTASAESSQVVIRPPLQGLASSNSDNALVVEESVSSTSVATNGFVLGPACSSSPEKLHGQDPGSNTSRGRQTKRTFSGSSQGSRSSRGSGSRSVGSIAKLGKRYCCFGSF